MYKTCPTCGGSGSVEETKTVLNLIDMREHARPKYPTYGRDWKNVTGITLHQTACLLGERPERWETVGCHVGVTRGGKVIHLHDFNKVVVHGHGWNARCVGIEIDGLYAGIQGDPRTVWDDKSTVEVEKGMDIVQVQVEQVKQSIRWICEKVRFEGGEVKFLVAHRQASADRINDPGSGLWQAIAVPMKKELGLKHGDSIDFKLNDGQGGRAIPECWDPECVGIPY